jgi:hypothetical protein
VDVTSHPGAPRAAGDRPGVSPAAAAAAARRCALAAVCIGLLPPAKALGPPHHYDSLRAFQKKVTPRPSTCFLRSTKARYSSHVPVPGQVYYSATGKMGHEAIRLHEVGILPVVGRIFFWTG